MPGGITATGGRDMTQDRSNDESPAGTSPVKSLVAPGAPAAASITGAPARVFPGALPRGLIIVLAVAGIVVVAAGMRAIPGILGPVFLALVLTILVDPIRGLLIRHHAPRWLASIAAFLAGLLIVLGLVAATVLGIIQLVRLIPEYADDWQQTLADVQSWLADLGVSTTDIQSMLQQIDPTTIASFAEGLLSSLSGVLSGTLFTVVLLIFLAVDGTVFPQRMARARAGHEIAFDGLRAFASGTRRYFGVATIFGAIVAVLDTAALLILGVPAAFLWGLLAFVTNYIPNVGFIIGLIPPTILAFLQGGPGLAITVLIVYCVLNFVIQSVLQPKFVGDAVGLTTTMSFLSLIIWTFILGPIGAILAIPASLLVKGMLVDIDPQARWLQLFLGDAADPSPPPPPPS
jgi:AI-2 transport protein TqsA